jgi:hypothetical protein
MRVLFPLLVVFVMCNCAGYQYVAAPQYVPFNSRKGDLKTNLFYNNVQVGYALTNHISAFATGYKHAGQTVATSLDKWPDTGVPSYADKAHAFNMGTSYFASSKRFIYEIQAGAGMGKIFYRHKKDYFDPYIFEMNAKKQNIFIQPSVALNLPLDLSKLIQFGVFAKFVREQYYDLNVASATSASHPIDKQDQYFMNRYSRNLYFVEPGICMRLGGKWIKGNTTLSIPYDLGNGNIRVRPFSVSMNVFIILNLLN